MSAHHHFEIGNTVIMPDPDPTEGDIWTHGGFAALVTDFRESNGNLIVEDQDGDFFEVEPWRVKLAD